VTTVIQAIAVIGPPIVWYVTWRVCRQLTRRPGPERTERAGVIERSADGGYHGAPAEQPEEPAALGSAE
jgi:hypothetical protein